MSAARKRAFNGRSMASGSRNAAYAAININWKQISPDGDRDERLAWISEYLGREVSSLTELTDEQLGTVAGEMKRLTGHTTGPRAARSPANDNVVDFVSGANIHRSTVDDANWSVGCGPVGNGVAFLATNDQVYTLEKLDKHIGWNADKRSAFLNKRFSSDVFRRFTFDQATKATNALLRIAAHHDLKKRNGGKPVSRTEINKYIPLLKAELRIDQYKR